MKVINSKISPTVISLGICFNLLVITKLPQQWHSRSTTPAISSLIAGWLLDCTWLHIAFQTITFLLQLGPLLIWLITADFVDKFSTSPHTSELNGQYPTPVPTLDMLSFVSSEKPLSPIMVNSPLADAADYSWFCLSVLPLLIHLVFIVKFPTPVHHSFASYRKAPFSHCQLADVVETENRIFTSKHQDLYFYNFLRTLSCSISQAHFSPFSADVLLPIAPEIDFCPRGRAATTTICPRNTPTTTTDPGSTSTTAA